MAEAAYALSARTAKVADLMRERRRIGPLQLSSGRIVGFIYFSRTTKGVPGSEIGDTERPVRAACIRTRDAGMCVHL